MNESDVVMTKEVYRNKYRKAYFYFVCDDGLKCVMIDCESLLRWMRNRKSMRDKAFKEAVNWYKKLEKEGRNG